MEGKTCIKGMEEVLFFIGQDEFLSTVPIFRTRGSFDLSAVKQIKNEPSTQSPAGGVKPARKGFMRLFFFLFTAWFLERITGRNERVSSVTTQKWDFEISGLIGNDTRRNI